MKNPFETQDARERMQKLIDRLNDLRTEIDSVRVWLAPQLDVVADERESELEGCTCVYDEVFELDALLFSVYRMMHLIGSGVVTHLHRIDAHESRAKAAPPIAAKLIPLNEEALRSVLESVPTETTAMPPDVDDKGPGPNGAH